MRQDKLALTELENQREQRITTSSKLNTALGIGNETSGASVKEEVSRNASKGIEPRNILMIHEGQGFHRSEAGKEPHERVSVGKGDGV